MNEESDYHTLLAFKLYSYIFIAHDSYVNRVLFCQSHNQNIPRQTAMLIHSCIIFFYLRSTMTMKVYVIYFIYYQIDHFYPNMNCYFSFNVASSAFL